MLLVSGWWRDDRDAGAANTRPTAARRGHSANETQWQFPIQTKYAWLAGDYKFLKSCGVLRNFIKPHSKRQG